MHDFLEGICRYGVALVLYYLIYVRQYFRLQHLNLKIRAFHYGAKSSTNKPPEILEQHLKKKCILLSSSEMLNIVKHLNLIIGLSVDENDKCWKLLLDLQEILQTICSTKITLDTTDILEQKISDYLMLLNEIFPNSMKPKHLFALHYASVMRQVGPLWNICCMRFESKHREGKQISRSAICRVNICRTIALRHQLIFNYRLMSKNSTYPTYICGPIKFHPIHKLPNISFFLQLLPDSLSSSNISSTNWLQHMGRTIKEGSVIVTFSELGPDFYLAYLIILIGEHDFLIVSKYMNDVYLNERIRAYKVHSTENLNWHILKKTDIENAVVSYTNKLSDGLFYIPKTWM